MKRMVQMVFAVAWVLCALTAVLGPAGAAGASAAETEATAGTPEAEAEASKALSLAKTYLDSGLREKALEKLCAVVVFYPGTEAAKEAEVRLSGFPPQQQAAAKRKVEQEKRELEQEKQSAAAAPQQQPSDVAAARPAPVGAGITRKASQPHDDRYKEYATAGRYGLAQKWIAGTGRGYAIVRIRMPDAKPDDSVLVLGAEFWLVNEGGQTSGYGWRAGVKDGDLLLVSSPRKGPAHLKLWGPRHPSGEVPVALREGRVIDGGEITIPALPSDELGQLTVTLKGELPPAERGTAVRIRSSTSDDCFIDLPWTGEDRTQVFPQIAAGTYRIAYVRGASYSTEEQQVTVTASSNAETAVTAYPEAGIAFDWWFRPNAGGAWQKGSQAIRPGSWSPKDWGISYPIAVFTQTGAACELKPINCEYRSMPAETDPQTAGFPTDGFPPGSEKTYPAVEGTMVAAKTGTRPWQLYIRITKVGPLDTAALSAAPAQGEAPSSLPRKPAQPHDQRYEQFAAAGKYAIGLKWAAVPGKGYAVVRIRLADAGPDDSVLAWGRTTEFWSVKDGRSGGYGARAVVKDGDLLLLADSANRPARLTLWGLRHASGDTAIAFRSGKVIDGGEITVPALPAAQLGRLTVKLQGQPSNGGALRVWSSIPGATFIDLPWPGSDHQRSIPQMAAGTYRIAYVRGFGKSTEEQQVTITAGAETEAALTIHPEVQISFDWWFRPKATGAWQKGSETIRPRGWDLPPGTGNTYPMAEFVQTGAKCELRPTIADYCAVPADTDPEEARFPTKGFLSWSEKTYPAVAGTMVAAKKRSEPWQLYIRITKAEAVKGK